MRPRARVGCSGWEYKHWKGSFYPLDLPRQRWLEHYTRTFDTVEINNSFYRLPPLETMRSWRRQAPAGFVYAVKASRYLTHMRKLKEPADPLALLFGRARELGPHLGPVLYQLPPRWRPDHARLEAFLRALPKDVPQAIEFREAAWYSDHTFALLSKWGVALCLHDMVGSAPPRLVVGPFVYVRFHGATAKYSGSYSSAQLEEWAEWLDGRLTAGLRVYVYFNNDVGGHAPRNAVTLREALAAPCVSRTRRKGGRTSFPEKSLRTRGAAPSPREATRRRP